MEDGVQGRVVSWHKSVLPEVQSQAIGQGAIKVALLAVSGAFHTSLMQPAQDKLRLVMSSGLSSCTPLLCKYDAACFGLWLYLFQEVLLLL